MANGMPASACLPPLNGRSNSMPVEDGTLERQSTSGPRRVKSPRATATRAEKIRRRGSPHITKNQLPGDSNQSLNHRRHVTEIISQRALDAGYTPTESQGHMHWASRPELNRSYTNPTPLTSPSANDMRGHGSMMNSGKASSDLEMFDRNSTPNPTEKKKTEYEGMLLQLEVNNIEQVQLEEEVKKIELKLNEIEKECIDSDKAWAETKRDLSEPQWRNVVEKHLELLYEHHNFFLASHHPIASEELKWKAAENAMPSRMWRYGIHSFLELLRQKLPKSLVHMQKFIYNAYPMITLLLETVPTFRETWIECLGDLSRYRMAIEESDMRDREVWAGISRYWYNLDADQRPDVGRIQHHLAVLARPDGLQQLFYYTKALVTVRPFHNARYSISLLFNLYRDQPVTQNTMIPAFIMTHGVLFTRGTNEQFVTLANTYLSLLRREIHQLDRQGQQHQQGVYISSCNFASILQYGEADGIMRLEFIKKERRATAEAHRFALYWTSNQTSDYSSASISGMSNSTSDSVSPITSRASFLTFHTLALFLEQIGFKEIYPAIHTSLAFIWCLSLKPIAMQQLETIIPWLAIAKFLNTLLQQETNFDKIENEAFPVGFKEAKLKQLSEDFLIRGQLWSQLYYPEDFFENAPSVDNRPVIEEEATMIPRQHRCLWLGVRLATFNRWMTYSRTHGFVPTQLVHEFAPFARSCGSLNSRAIVPGPTTTPAPELVPVPADHDMSRA
ncbi:DNA/RNA-binding domain E.t1.c1-type [Penicillium verhagenii]|nr:DNA/RNA-binding domain E.t1.c1-type [Penicillium verhagenii]